MRTAYVILFSGRFLPAVDPKRMTCIDCDSCHNFCLVEELNKGERIPVCKKRSTLETIRDISRNHLRSRKLLTEHWRLLSFLFSDLPDSRSCPTTYSALRSALCMRHDNGNKLGRVRLPAKLQRQVVFDLVSKS